MEQVILIDEHDNAIGTMEKIAAHKEGKLHRAVSVLIFNEKNELLLQQRAETKYHSATLWTNTCCGHPRPKETSRQAAERRLFEEMGIESNLVHWFSFSYRIEFENGLTENEYDHVYIGRSHAIPKPNVHEVMNWKYMPVPVLEPHLENEPQDFSYWFKRLWIESKSKPNFQTLI